MINKDKDEENSQKANEYKEMGNDAFRQAQYKRAMELYTSALMVKDDSHILYTNRAQALIKLGKHLDASHDCRKAIKLKPEFIKAYIHLSKALKELGEFQEAIDTLERAEDISEEQAKVVRKYKMDMIEEQKRSFIELNKKWINKFPPSPPWNNCFSTRSMVLAGSAQSSRDVVGSRRDYPRNLKIKKKAETKFPRNLNQPFNWIILGTE